MFRKTQEIASPHLKPFSVESRKTSQGGRFGTPPPPPPTVIGLTGELRRDIEKWTVSRPSAIGMYVCTYIPTDRLSVTKTTSVVWRPIHDEAMSRCRKLPAVPVQSDPLSRRRRRHQGHCLRRSSDLVGRREGGRYLGRHRRAGGGGGVTRGCGVRGDDRLMANGGVQCS